MKNDLGNKLVELRKQKKFTQEKVADELSVTRQTISNWELNQTKPDIDQIKGLSKLYNISVDELIDNSIKEILTEKISNVEKLTGLVYKILKVSLVFLFIFIIIFIYSKLFLNTSFYYASTKSINCNLNGENYSIEIESASPTVVNSILKNKTPNVDNIPVTNVNIFPNIAIPDLEKYNKEYQVQNVVLNYFKSEGGRCN